MNWIQSFISHRYVRELLLFFQLLPICITVRFYSHVVHSMSQFEWSFNLFNPENMAMHCTRWLYYYEKNMQRISPIAHSLNLSLSLSLTRGAMHKLLSIHFSWVQFYCCPLHFIGAQNVFPCEFSLKTFSIWWPQYYTGAKLTGMSVRVYVCFWFELWNNFELKKLVTIHGVWIWPFWFATILIIFSSEYLVWFPGEWTTKIARMLEQCESVRLCTTFNL